MTSALCLICQNPIFAASASASFCSESCMEQAQQMERAFICLIEENPLSLHQFLSLLRENYPRELARQMVWRQGRREFMVCEDYTFATNNLRELHLHPAKLIYPVSRLPVHWQEVFWDYEQIPLVFTKHDRTVFVNIKNPWFLTQAAMHPAPEVRHCVARNPNLPLPLLEKLALDSIPMVRVGVALNLKTPEWLLQELAQDQDKNVCEVVALHPNTPGNAFAHLMREAAQDGRDGILAQPVHIDHLIEVLNTSQQSVIEIEQYIHQQSWNIRGALADHPQIALPILELLTQDVNPNVRQVAKAQLVRRSGRPIGKGSG